MIYMWFTGINYYKLAVETDRDSIFTIIFSCHAIMKPNPIPNTNLLNTRDQPRPQAPTQTRGFRRKQ
jgi:hypothetical protein